MDFKLTVVQQYLSWKGHYRQYFENLLDRHFSYLYVSKAQELYPNGDWIQDLRDTDNTDGIVAKIKGRFINSYIAYKRLSQQPGKAAHLIEFEPLTFLIFSKMLSEKSLIITIHSSDNLHYANWVSNTVSKLQRRLLERALRVSVRQGARIVTHYECHRQSIIAVVGEKFADQVEVIHYPAPYPTSNEPKVLAVGRIPTFLIYGQIREDKGIFEFFRHESTKNLHVTIAGRIIDTRLLEISDRPNLKIINKFLTDSEISDLIDAHDYMLLPYPLTYTNGAGTFKDSLAKAMPVVCSNISIFSEIVGDYKVGVIFNSADEILQKVNKVDTEEYNRFSKNCLDYALKYDWTYMRNAYFSIYGRTINAKAQVS